MTDMYKENNLQEILEEWVDVTEYIRDFSQSLTFHNNFVAYESFSLFEAMSAVEVMVLNFTY